MYTLLIMIIYLAFISLGLPDSLLGSCWPSAHVEINASISSVGIISMIISFSTIISALFSDRLTNRFGTSKVTVFSVFVTAASMFLFSVANNFWQLCLIAIPYGLGAGCIDASLNDYVALHLKASHLSWLHCMWGVGASISPAIMSYALTELNSWRMGYRIMSIIQLVIAIILLISLPIWNIAAINDKQEDVKQVSIPISKVIGLKGVKPMLIAFLLYCGLEALNFVWASSFFSLKYKVVDETAALLGSLYYSGMMIGRAISGFITNKLGDKKLIRIGSITIVISALIMSIVSNYYVSILGFLFVGLGSAPIYPSLIHETPLNFNRQYSQSIIGVQMAVAYTGTTLSPYLFGLIADYVDIGLLPVMELVFGLLIFVLCEKYHKETLDG